MIIGINAQNLTLDKPTGVEVATAEIVLNLPRNDPGNTYQLYTPKPLSSKYTSSSNVSEVVVPGTRFWHTIILPKALKANHLSAFLEPSQTVPLPSIPTIVIVHDLAWRLFPHAYSAKERLHQHYALSRTAKYAKHIIFVSQSTKNDFNRFYKFPEEKQSVVPLGIDPKKFQQKGPQIIKEPYFLYVGRLEERKNVGRIISAYIRWRQNSNNQAKLILAGRPGFGHKKFLGQIEALSKTSRDIIISNYISTDQLVNYYQHAKALIFPSLHEGFGLPILEAFAAGTPVITSNTSSLPEVAGGAAILVDPLSESKICDAMNQINSDMQLRQELIAKGYTQLKNFSWEITTKSIAKIINSIR